MLEIKAEEGIGPRLKWKGRREGVSWLNLLAAVKEACVSIHRGIPECSVKQASAEIPCEFGVIECSIKRAVCKVSAEGGIEKCPVE